MTKEHLDLLKDRVLAYAGVGDIGEVAYTPGEALELHWTQGLLRVTAPDPNAVARGIFLAAQAQRSGQRELHAVQRRHFASCGAMLDMSRGGVMKAEAVKRYMDAMACLGLNLLMLYTEDTYPVEGYPHMGYLRGRYTRQELRELDQYALEMGIELVPCIQTLAHLEQFLQWRENEHMKDTNECLMIGEADTYRFIEAEIKAVRGCFRSNRIHIGMDEAHGVGLGHYFAKHGLADRFALLNRHLKQVVEICKRHAYEPIMWSDMYFRLGSQTNDYYDPQAVIPPEVVADIPEVALCYWDYYHTEEGFYADMLARHQEMGRETVFAGGNWTWSGFLPQVRCTEANSVPALRACLKQGVQTVLATHWGDDGCETNYFLALNQLPLFSEHCWLGEACDLARVHALGAALTGIPQEAYQAFGAFYQDHTDHRPGKGLFYCDPLYPLMHDGRWRLDELGADMEKAVALLEAHLQDERCAYAHLLQTIALEKLDWIRRLRSAYLRGDKQEVRDMAQNALERLKNLYQRFLELYRAQWEGTNKRNGWETLCIRLGGIVARLEDTRRILLQWAGGEVEAVPELEEEPLDAMRRGGSQDYAFFTLPKYWW